MQLCNAMLHAHRRVARKAYNFDVINKSFSYNPNLHVHQRIQTIDAVNFACSCNFACSFACSSKVDTKKKAMQV